MQAAPDPAAYDAWYRTPRGAWIGETEYRLLRRLLDPRPGDSLLDAGCGSGYFSRRFAAEGLRITGVDHDPAMLDFARAQAGPGERYVPGDLRALPFPDGTFEHAISVAALCFIDEDRQAVEEILRVTRRRFAIGFLNRRSLLHRQKGRDGGQGAYRGAHWHDGSALRRLFAGLPVRDLRWRTAVLLPDGGILARTLEGRMTEVLPWGALRVVAGELSRPS